MTLFRFVGVLPIVVASVVSPAPPSAATAAPSARTVPYFTQETRGCAGACAAMIRRHAGDLAAHPSDYDDLVDHARGGVSTVELAGRLRRQGFRVETSYGSPDALCDDVARSPVIALIGPDAPRLHFVVVVACEGSEIVFHDPAVGPYRRERTARFDRWWARGERWMLRADPVTPAPTAPTTPDPRPTPKPTTPRARAIAAAERGALGVADSLFTDLLHHDPDDAQLRVLRAGVRLRRGRHQEAARDARRALEHSPGHATARRYLGAALHLQGREREALAHWNRLDRPHTGYVFVRGTRQTRYPVVEDVLDLPVDDLLTPELLRRTERRLEALPTVHRARVRHRMQTDGRAWVDAAVVERARWPSPRRWLAANTLRWAVEREVDLKAAHLFGTGDVWSVGARTERHRRATWFELRAPTVPARAWITSLAYERAEETYATPRTLGRTTTSRIAVGASSWITHAVRTSVGVARRTSRAGDRHHGLRLAVRWAGARDARSVDVGLDAWSGRARAPAFLGGHLDVAWRGSRAREALRGEVALSLHAVSDDAPPWAWPGAGTGRARNGVLRAHPLLTDGVITGPAFAPRLANATVEGQWWSGGWGPLRTGLAAFVDTARASGAGRRSEHWVDVGVGLRIDLPGLDRDLRIDPAYGILDGARALSVTLR